MNPVVYCLINDGLSCPKYGCRIDATEKEILCNDSLLKLWIQRNIVFEYHFAE